MSQEFSTLIETTINNQLHASLDWETHLLLGRHIGQNGTVPSGIEMTLRNPAQYHGAVRDGEVSLPQNLTDRWAEVSTLASRICRMSGIDVELENLDAPIEVAKLASMGVLSMKTVRPLTKYLDESSEVFSDSLPLDHKDELFLELLARNASRAVGKEWGVTEAVQSMRYAESTALRIANRQSR